MSKLILAAAAAGVFALSSTAFSADSPMYVTKDASGKMVVNGEAGGSSDLVIGQGAKPADCPPGRYYLPDASQTTVKACDDEKAEFILEAPPAGATLSNGQPYPEGTMIMKSPGG